MSNGHWANKVAIALLAMCVGSVLGGCWARVQDGHDGDRRERHDGDHDHHEDHRDDHH
jgi:hypothetical protein